MNLSQTLLGLAYKHGTSRTCLLAYVTWTGINNALAFLFSFLVSCVLKGTLSATFLSLKPAQVAFNSCLLRRPILVRLTGTAQFGGISQKGHAAVLAFFPLFFLAFGRYSCRTETCEQWNSRTFCALTLFFFTDITGDNAGWKRKGDRAAYTTALSGCRRTKWNIYSRWTRGTVFGEYVETNMSACHVTIVFGASYSTISFTHFLQCHEAPATSRTFFAASFCDILDAFSAVSRCCFFLPCASLKIVSLYLFLLPCP